MKPRSPVLGYNHNVRYAARLWHVQTEDSGVNNPHIFTHLFHEGTILATKRADYDPTSDVAAVQKVMQVQHKAMLRDLKAGAFDEKITRFFGTPIIKEREDQTDPGASLSGEFETAPKTDPTMQAPTPLNEVAPSVAAGAGGAGADAARGRAARAAAAGGAHRSVFDDERAAHAGAVAAEPDAVAAGDSRRRVALGRARGASTSAGAARAGHGRRRAARTGGASVRRRQADGRRRGRGAAVGDCGRLARRHHARQSARASAASRRRRRRRIRNRRRKRRRRRRPTTSSAAISISEKSLDEVILAYLSEDLNEK